MTPDEARYARMVKVRHEEWHVLPSRYVQDSIDVFAFTQRIQAEWAADQRRAENMARLREQMARMRDDKPWRKS
jgi:hypothetical protein